MVRTLLSVMYTAGGRDSESGKEVSLKEPILCSKTRITVAVIEVYHFMYILL